MDPRSIWLVTYDGNPMYFAWGLVKTPSEEPDPLKRNANSVLTQDQVIDGRWDATVTAWRSVPAIARPGFLDNATPILSGRTLNAGGCRWSLDATGRPRGSGFEPTPPDTEIIDNNALVTLIENVGVAVAFIEKGTGEPIRVYPTPLNGPPNGSGIALYRQNGNGQVVRVNLDPPQ